MSPQQIEPHSSGVQNACWHVSGRGHATPVSPQTHWPASEHFSPRLQQRPAQETPPLGQVELAAQDIGAGALTHCKILSVVLRTGWNVQCELPVHPRTRSSRAGITKCRPLSSSSSTSPTPRRGSDVPSK